MKRVIIAAGLVVLVGGCGYTAASPKTDDTASTVAALESAAIAKAKSRDAAITNVASARACVWAGVNSSFCSETKEKKPYIFMDGDNKAVVKWEEFEVHVIEDTEGQWFASAPNVSL